MEGWQREGGGHFQGKKDSLLFKKKRMDTDVPPATSPSIY